MSDSAVFIEWFACVFGGRGFLWATAISASLMLAVPAGALAAPDAAEAGAAAINQSSATAAAVPSTEPVSMKAVIVEVHGLVQARTADDQPWKTGQVGMILGEGASLRTGPRAWVTCQIPPDQTFRLDRLGTVKINEAIRTGKKVKTDLIMEYGRTQYDIEAAGVEHESTIRSPSSTLAVRGTNVILTDEPPFAPEATSFSGTAVYADAQRETKLGGRDYAHLNDDDGTAAQTALNQSVVDPQSAEARTPSEATFISQQVSRGAVFGFDQKAGIPTVTNGPGPQTNAEVQASLPGVLSLILRWTGNANLNLIADNEAGNPATVIGDFQPTELLYPGYGLNVSSSGGKIPYDDRGGPKGGQEVAFWGPNYPHGVYGFSAVDVSGAPATADFTAYLNGKPLEMLSFTADETGVIRTTELVRPVTVGNSVSAIVFIPPDASITDNFPPETDTFTIGAAPVAPAATVHAAAIVRAASPPQVSAPAAVAASRALSVSPAPMSMTAMGLSKSR